MYKPPASLYIEQARNRTLLMHEAQLRKHSRRKKYKTKKSLSNCSNTRDTIDRKGTKKKMGTVNNIIQNNDPLLMSDNPIPYLTIGRNSPEPATPNPPEHQDSATISNNVPRQSQKVGNSISESTKEEKSNDRTAVHCVNEVQPFVPPSVLNKPKIATSCDIEREIVKDTGNCDQSCESLPRVHPALSLSVYFKLQKQKLNQIEILLSEMQQKNVNPQKSPRDEQDLSVEMSECSATTQAMRLPSTPHYSIITTDTDSLKVRLRRSGGMVETYFNEQNAISPVASLENNRHILTGEDVNMYLNLQGMKATSTALEIQESSIHNETERNNMQHSIPGNKQTIRHNCLFAPRTIDNGSYQHYTYNRATQALTLECKQKVTSHKVNVRIKSTTDEVMPKQKIIGSIISTDNAVTFKPVSDNQSTLYSTTSLPVDNEVQKPNNHFQQNNYNIQNPALMHSYEEKNGHETKPQDKMGTTKPAFSEDISKLIKVKSPTAQSIFEILQAEWNSDDNSTVMGIDEKKNKSQSISCNQEDKFNSKLKNDRNDVNKTQPLNVKSYEYKSFKTNKDPSHLSKSPIPNFYSNVKTSANNIMGLTPTKDLNKRKDESSKRILEHDISVHTETTNGYRLAANKHNFSVPSTAILVSVTTKQNSNGLLPTIENVFFKEGPVSGKHQNGGTPRQHESSKLTTERKVFRCNYPACNYTSNRQSHLNVHILGHTNDKTHKCTICSYGYNLGWKLEIHMKTAHKGKTDNQQNENEHQSTLDTPEKNSKEFKQEDMNDQNKEIDTLLVTEELPETVEKVDENVQENLKPEDEKKNNQINTFLTDYLACFDELLSDDDDEYDINEQPTGSINHGKEDTLVDEDHPIVHEAPDNNCCVSDPVESNTYEVNTLLSGSDSTSNGSVPNLCCMKRKIPGTGTHINCQTKRRKVKQ